MFPTSLRGITAIDHNAIEELFYTNQKEYSRAGMMNQVYLIGTVASFGVASNIMRMPYLGRRVTRGWGTTGKPGTRRGVKRWRMLATSSFVSISAKGMPMHMCGPPPKGK